MEGQEAEKKEEEAAAAPIAAEVQVQEPVLERCGSAALVSTVRDGFAELPG